MSTLLQRKIALGLNGNEIDCCVALRADMREQGRYPEADYIGQRLRDMGIALRDNNGYTDWEAK